jgi:outer membrane usher protein
MSLKVKFSRQNIFVILAVACVPGFRRKNILTLLCCRERLTDKVWASVNGPDTPAGEYLVDVMVNGSLIKSGVKIRLIQSMADSAPSPAFRYRADAGRSVKSLPDNALQNSCRPLKNWVSSGEWQFDSATLQLRLTLPMSELMHRPRGYIPPSQWDSRRWRCFYAITPTGPTHTTPASTSATTICGAASTLAAILDCGSSAIRVICAMPTVTKRWRLALQSRAHLVQRPLTAIDSIMAFGDNYTDSSLFGSLSFQWYETRHG